MNDDIVPTKKSKLSDNPPSTLETENPNISNKTESESNETILQTAVPNQTNQISSTIVPQRPKLLFKNPKFSYIEPGGKKFAWKSLKQITTQERSLPWPDDVVLYNSLNAPPSFKPAKKYSDLSGLEAPYTDPQTKLYYHNAEEFRIIRTLPSDIIQGYLALRGATNVVG